MTPFNVLRLHLDSAAGLAMDGWVSDHAVIDRDLCTCHVFTCVDIATMPESRKRGFVRMAEA